MSVVTKSLLGMLSLGGLLGGVWFVIQQQGDSAKIEWLKETQLKLSDGDILNIPGLSSFKEASKILMKMSAPREERVFIAMDWNRNGSPSSWEQFVDYAAENKGDAWFVDARTDQLADNIAVWSYEPWRKGMTQEEGEPLGQKIVVQARRHDENREKMEEEQYIELRKKYWADKKAQREKEDAEDEEEEEEEL